MAYLSKTKISEYLENNDKETITCQNLKHTVLREKSDLNIYIKQCELNG